MGNTAEVTGRYMGYRDASLYSGMSGQTLRRLVEAGRLKAYRPTGARKILLDRCEIDRLIHDSEAGVGSDTVRGNGAREGSIR
jgi:excisionase family DNA binding protein